MIITELKVGGLYVQPWDRKHQFIWDNPHNFSAKVVGRLEPTKPFMLLEQIQEYTWVKVLTVNGEVGWIDWGIEAFVKENSFMEARL